MNTPARPLSSVPLAVRLLLAAALALQLGWQAGRPPPRARAEALPPAPSPATLRLTSLGDPLALARLLMLYVQGHDDQAGVAIAWRDLDYGRIRQWLERVLELDPRSQYPLLAASEVYGAVGDPARVRQMLELVYERFGEDPDRRWPWLAHAAVVAQHRLHDLPLARRYAQAIRLHATGPQVPAWARELELFVLEDMDQAEATRALIGALLSSGQITDANELRFLERRLQNLPPPARQPAHQPR
ncbi:hypothetical protein HUX88_30820 [Duganella sp. BJB1802]|uniref:hypothetical protein n=1 Tax=Duganella sp. BJB1802 TaxID=2744575 RepID=UPI0015945C8F|nr:hypothetical protein [Duganella sp. BJB1802]NVD74879.1 hypothetical protein [Duganella sp. BJB1802]